MKYLFTILLAAVSAVAACDRVPLTSPTGSTITLTADRNVLPLNGQTTLHAIVIEAGGTPVHNGTVVTFAPTLGSVQPVEAETINGVATAIFNAGSISGKSSINAFSGGTKTAAATDITIGAAAAKTIALSASPSSVSQSGGTVTVAALVMDESGNPLPGVNVTFSADVGQLSPTVALSDENGVARTQLATTQTSKVTATAGTATKDVTVTVSSAPPVTITAPDTGTQGVPVAITVSTAATGSTSPRQVATLIVDYGDGTSETRSNVTGSVGFSHTYNSARGFTISATATDVAGNTGVASKAIVIARQQNPTVTLSAPATTPASTPIAVTFSGSATAPAQIVSARVTLQDGTVIFSGTQPNNFNYKFGGSGTYTLTGVVTDSNGNSASTSTTVFVTP